MSDPRKILEEFFSKASYEFNNDEGRGFLQKLNPQARAWISEIGKEPDRHKAVVTVLATLLTKKIEAPTQDIRYHREDLPNGFSGRTYDTQYITPFLKEKFSTKIAMKESGWLTRSFEKPEPYLLTYTGKITPKRIKVAFLSILNDVEKKGSEAAKEYLTALFIFLLRRRSEINKRLSEVQFDSEKEVTINRIIQVIRKFFSLPFGSRLPVLAVYAIYKIMIEEVSRYNGKILTPLRSHVSPDQYAGLGDIEIKDEKGEYFEIVEIKHNKPIDRTMLEDVYGKLEGKNVSRYYLLTTSEPCIMAGEEAEVQKWAKKIHDERGCEVITNGVIQTIQYYLRLLTKPPDFMKSFDIVLREEYRNRAEITDEHIRFWNEQLEKTRGTNNT